jgi:hypothetical protein
LAVECARISALADVADSDDYQPGRSQGLLAGREAGADDCSPFRSTPKALLAKVRTILP